MAIRMRVFPYSKNLLKSLMSLADNKTQPNTFNRGCFSIVVERVVAKMKDTFGCGI